MLYVQLGAILTVANVECLHVKKECRILFVCILLL
jgi:hypothetical protein